MKRCQKVMAVGERLTDGFGVWRRPLNTKAHNFERPVADLEVGNDSQKIGRFLRIFFKTFNELSD